MKAILTSLCTFMSITLLMWACGTTDPDVGGNTNNGGGDNGGSSSGTENSDATCDDGADNDGNGYTDCADFGCQNSCEVTVCGSENGEEACSDGIDNDGDGRVDCEDANCRTCTQACGPDETTLSSAPTVSITVVTVLPTAKTAIASNSSAKLKAAIPATKTPKKHARRCR